MEELRFVLTTGASVKLNRIECMEYLQDADDQEEVAEYSIRSAGRQELFLPHIASIRSIHKNNRGGCPPHIGSLSVDSLNEMYKGVDLLDRYLSTPNCYWYIKNSTLFIGNIPVFPQNGQHSFCRSTINVSTRPSLLQEETDEDERQDERVA
jgi:hypothetical protein